MRNLKDESFEFRQDLRRTAQILRFFWRYRSHPEALEPFYDVIPTSRFTKLMNREELTSTSEMANESIAI